VKKKVAVKDKKKLRTQINGEFSDISSADENKKITVTQDI
jgi:hypothetical protein